jgi:type VI secretion system protein ImpK
MSNGKPPFDPFGPGERTVIKPNPGGRREVPQPGTSTGQQPYQPPQVPNSAGRQDMWGGARELPQPPAAAQPVPQRVPFTPSQPEASPRPVRHSGNVQIPSFEDAALASGPNPILDAARPLLLLLSNVRIARQVPEVAPLMDAVVRGIDSFEASLRASGLNENDVRTAKYVICATADDIVQNLPNTDRLLWTQYSMLSRYFQTRDSGIGFFVELDKLRANPTVNFDLLSLMHACLSLGFEGKYRVAGGDVPLQQIRRDLYQTLRNLRSRTTVDIGPHWRGQEIPPEHQRRAVPVWSVGAVALGLLLAAFMAFRWLLGDVSDVTVDRLAALHPPGEINLARATFKPLEPVVIPQTTQLERIRQALADEIGAKRLSAEYAGKDIVIRLLNDSVFDKGSADVRENFLKALGKVAITLNNEKGEIRVVGHTDDTPLKSTLRFKDNQDLSEQRAKAVAILLLSGLADPGRLKTSGMADTAPINLEKTPEARAMNRRVEVFIPRDDI